MLLEKMEFIGVALMKFTKWCDKRMHRKIEKFKVIQRIRLKLLHIWETHDEQQVNLEEDKMNLKKDNPFPRIYYFHIF